MSKYTNYEKISQTYDELRHAGHVDTMTNVLCGILRKSPEDVKMLEAGCGTGNFSLGFLQNGIGHLTMIDASEGMLERAKQKVKGYVNEVREIKQHNLPTMPFEDGSFDCVTLVQVLHHLDTYHLKTTESNESAMSGKDNPEANTPHAPSNNYRARYPNLVRCIQEAYRVLKPKGVLLIDTSFEHNIDAHWISLAPKAANIFKQAFMPGNDLIELLQTENYKNVFFASLPSNSCTRTGLYHNAELIFDENWRKSLSEWSFIERTGELAGVLDLVKKQKDAGQLEQFAWDMNKKFRLVGETTTVFAQKPAESL